MAKSQPTRTLLRGLATLEALADSQQPLGVTEIAQRVSLDKATVSRLLATLIDAGYVAQDSQDSRYRVASKVLRLSRGFGANQAMRDIAMPYLQNLRDHTDETVHLGQMQNTDVVYVEKLDTTRSVRLTSAVGQTNPLHSTGLGKAILAACDEDQRDKIVKTLKLDVKQPNTIRTHEELIADLEETRKRGYSIDDCENEENVTCVGAAIRRNSFVLGAVSIAGPSFRMQDNVDNYGRLVAATAEEISTAEADTFTKLATDSD